MSQLTIRNLEETTLQRLKDRARLSRRSLEAEVRAILNEAVCPDRTELARRAAAIRERAAAYRGDATAEIRRDRDR